MENLSFNIGLQYAAGKKFSLMVQGDFDDFSKLESFKTSLKF